MSIDKDRPSTWVRYRKDNCVSCKAHCCSMPVEVTATDLVKLGLAHEDEILRSLKKTAKRLIKEKFVQSYREGTELFTMSQRPNGDCQFLDPLTRICGVYERRPQVCRDFPEIVSPRLGHCPSTSKYKK